MELNKIYRGDCLEVMKQLPDDSVDMILTDLPYSRTKNHWDVIIPLEPMWEQYLRIAKENACIALFADGMFMADLMKSQESIWKYNLVWDKVLTSGFLNANRMPLKAHEEICIFYRKPPVYNPQKVPGNRNHSKGSKKVNKNHNYGDYGFVDNHETLGEMKHPTSILRFQKPHPSKSLHPTEKSVELCEWLIKTYTNPRGIVLDSCIGSGTTCLAAIKNDRYYIGIDLEEQYCRVAENRIREYLTEKESTEVE